MFSLEKKAIVLLGVWFALNSLLGFELVITLHRALMILGTWFIASDVFGFKSGFEK